MTKPSDIYRYWGKTGEDGRFHLLYHCLDVAAVGWVLLDPRKPLCRWLASGLGVEPEWLRRWVVFCLALHDMGKFAVAFQGLVTHLGSFLVAPCATMPYTERHDTLGFLLWQERLAGQWLRERVAEIDAAERRQYLMALAGWLEIVTGHHGVPPKRGAIPYQSFFTQDDEVAAWEYCRAVSDLFLDGLDLKPLADKAFRKEPNISRGYWPA